MVLPNAAESEDLSQIRCDVPVSSSRYNLAHSRAYRSSGLSVVDWEPAVRHEPLGDGGRLRRVHRGLRLTVVVAGLLFALSGLLDALRAMSQIFPIDDWYFFRLFFTSTGFGRLTVYKLSVTLLFLVAFWLQAGRLWSLARPAQPCARSPYSTR